MSAPILQLQEVHASYGKSHVLHGVTMHVDSGEIVSLMGRNGMGKTSVLRAIVGLLPAHGGEITFEGRSIQREAVDAIARAGIALVPADRGIFTLLSVEENLRIAARAGAEWNLDRVFESFPRLKERRRNLGGALSGGEQQMLAIARALLQGPRLLLLDEPTEGLAPVIVDELVGIIAGVGRSGTPIVLVEQTYSVCRTLASRHYILEEGQVVFCGATADLDRDPGLLDRYLGMATDDPLPAPV
jgi:branched-chain amino acid transport system ATP-binding protein